MRSRLTTVGATRPFSNLAIAGWLVEHSSANSAWVTPARLLAALTVLPIMIAVRALS